MVTLMLLADAERLGIVTPWTDHISTGCCCFRLLDQFPQVCGLEDVIESVFWYDFAHDVGLGSSPENPAVLATAGYRPLCYSEPDARRARLGSLAKPRFGDV
jgi:hypothetical protein